MNTESEITTVAASRTPLCMRLFRWALVGALVVIWFLLLLWFGRLLFTWVILPAFVERHIVELSRLTGWGLDTTLAATMISVLAATLLTRFAFRRDPLKRWAA